MQGTRIIIEATTPFVFSADEAERDGYAEMVASIVRSHGVTDVAVTLGDSVEWASVHADEAQADEASPETTEASASVTG